MSSPVMPAIRPRSRLHAAALALANWDSEHNEDGMRWDDARVEHWAGAREVWDSIEPKLITRVELELARPGTVIHKPYRGGITVYTKLSGDDWRTDMSLGNPLEDGPIVSSLQVITRHGSVRVLWAPE